MIGSALKRTLVHGGAGLEREPSSGATREGLGDAFADSISSALERLVSPAPRPRSVPLGMEASVAPLVQAEDDDDEHATHLEAGALGASERWGTGATWGKDVRRLEARKITSPSQLYAASGGGMAVWEGAGLDAHAPFSEPPRSTPSFEGVAPTPPGSSLASAVVRELDDEPMPLVTRRAHANEEIRTRPTRPEELAGEPALAGDGIVARVGTVRVGSPEVRERVPRLRPPSLAPASRAGASSSSDRASVAQRSREARADEAPAGEPERRGQRSDVREQADDPRGERGDSSGSSREGSDREHPRQAAQHARATRGAETDAERPFTSVHTVPLLAVGESPSLVAGAPPGAPERGPIALPVGESGAANGPADARVENVPYHVVRLDDRTARVELAHPELGRVQVEVHTEQGRVDVELLARSLSASIALRAAEPELRGDLRQRGASLRNYRVRTAPDGVAWARGERQR